MGGVLIELDAERQMRAFVGDIPREELWRRWLLSPAVREHEVGRMSPEDFAAAVLREFGSSAGVDAFLESFHHWIVGPFPGAGALIDELAARYRMGLLTNTCAYHWSHPAIAAMAPQFHHVIASHLAGVIKPDREFFELALTECGVTAGEAIFFDDNEINCEGARACGIEAHRVLGTAALREALMQRGLL